MVVGLSQVDFDHHKSNFAFLVVEVMHYFMVCNDIVHNRSVENECSLT